MTDQPEFTQLVEPGLVHCFSFVFKLLHERKTSRIGEQMAGIPGLEVRGAVKSGYAGLEDVSPYPCSA